MLRLLPLSLGLALIVVSGAGAWAATPSAELRGFFADATLILTDPETDGKHAARLTAIRAITRQIFDFREATRLALGPVWRERTPAERDTFVQLYADLLERAFIAWIAARAQIAGGPRVTFLGETVDEGHATVRTTVLGRTGQELSLDYRMIERGDRWAVRDVVIDGVSLAANYRAQFTRVIQSSSYPELVRQLQSRMSVPPPEAIASGESRPAPDALGVPPRASASRAVGGAVGNRPRCRASGGPAAAARRGDRARDQGLRRHSQGRSGARPDGWGWERLDDAPRACLAPRGLLGPGRSVQEPTGGRASGFAPPRQQGVAIASIVRSMGRDHDVWARRGARARRALRRPRGGRIEPSSARGARIQAVHRRGPRESPMRFEGKVALISAAGAGIGRATAGIIGREGGTVVAVDVAQGALDRLTSEIAGGGGRALGIRADALDAASVEDAVRQAVGAHGRIDILVNAVGLRRRGEKCQGAAPVPHFVDNRGPWRPNPSQKQRHRASRSTAPRRRQTERNRLLRRGS